jgi:hypothetical protein
MGRIAVILTGVNRIWNISGVILTAVNNMEH